MCTSPTKENNMPVPLETRRQNYVLDPNRKRPRCVRHIWADCTLDHFSNDFFNFSGILSCSNTGCPHLFVATKKKPTFNAHDNFQVCITPDCNKLRCLTCKNCNINV